MIQVPDIEHIQKGGIVIVLLMVVGLLVSVIIWFAKNYLLAPPKASNGLPRELRAGEKDAEFWQRDFDSRAAAQTRILVEHLGKLRARLRSMDEKIDQHHAVTKDDIAQVRRDIAVLARAIELRDRE